MTWQKTLSFNSNGQHVVTHHHAFDLQATWTQFRFGDPTRDFGVTVSSIFVTRVHVCRRPTSSRLKSRVLASCSLSTPAVDVVPFNTNTVFFIAWAITFDEYMTNPTWSKYHVSKTRGHLPYWVASIRVGRISFRGEIVDFSRCRPKTSLQGAPNSDEISSTNSKLWEKYFFTKR